MNLLVLRLHYQGPMVLSKIAPHHAPSTSRPTYAPMHRWRVIVAQAARGRPCWPARHHAEP